MNKRQKALIEKIKELHGKATQGEWTVATKKPHHSNWRGILIGNLLLGTATFVEDAETIAFYHNNILELVRIIEELEKENKRVTKMYEKLLDRM